MGCGASRPVVHGDTFYPSPSVEQSDSNHSSPNSSVRDDESPLASMSRRTSTEISELRPRVNIGTSPNTLRGRWRAPLDSHEVQQSAYIVGASAVGDPISQPKRFAKAGHTLNDVRTLLNHGRGNVHSDSKASNGYNGIVSSVAEQGLDTSNKLALAASLGGGLCDHHAGLVGIVHALHMTSDEESVQMGAKIEMEDLHGNVSTEGHAWRELNEGGRRDADSTIVMDAWANGPAVRLKDSAWKEAAARAVRTDTKDQALNMKDRVEGLMPLIHPTQDDYTASRLNASKRNPTQWSQFGEAQVVSKDFAKEVRDALYAMPPDSQYNLVASVVSQTYGLNQAEASDSSLGYQVLQEAYSLDQQSRPEVHPSND